MEYFSTRSQQDRVTAAQAIAQGLAPDGGLFLPEEFPALSQSDLEELTGMKVEKINIFVEGVRVID